MSTTITTTITGSYAILDPWKQIVVPFNTIMAAIDYCRSHGLIYSIEV